MIDDLHQAGAMGLLEAARRFDPSRGYRFSTYAVPWITRHLYEEVAQSGGTMRIPRKTLELVNRVARRSRELASTVGQTVSVEAACDDLGVPKGSRLRVADALAVRNASYVSDEVTTAAIPEDDTDPADIVANGEDVGALRDRILAAVNTLSPRRRDIVTRLYGLAGDPPVPLRIIASDLGFSLAWAETLLDAARGQLGIELADLAIPAIE
ncbi:sigma-70 family RNA polymerase sigma factor [Singulisphaera rosea]